MGNTQTYKYSLPEDIGVDLQQFLDRVGKDIEVFGCVIVQDPFNDYKYIIDNNVFTVEDRTGNGQLFVKKILNDRYKCTFIEEDDDKEDEGDDDKEDEDKEEDDEDKEDEDKEQQDELIEGMEKCTLAAEDAVGESKVVAGEELEEGN